MLHLQFGRSDSQVRKVGTHFVPRSIHVNVQQRLHPWWIVFVEQFPLSGCKAEIVVGMMLRQAVRGDGLELFTSRRGVDDHTTATISRSFTPTFQRHTPGAVALARRWATCRR